MGSRSFRRRCTRLRAHVDLSVLRIGNGVISIADQREHKRVKKQAERAAKKPSATGGVADDPTPASRDDLTSEQQTHYDKMVAVLGPPTPRVNGNSGEMSTDEAKARMARLAEEEAPPVAPEASVEEVLGEAPHTLTPEEISDEALAAFKTMAFEYFAKMLKPDLARVRVWVSEQTAKHEKGA